MQPLSTSVVVVTLLSLLLGVVTQAVQSGKVFGQFQVPAKAMTYIMVVFPLLGGFVASLQAAGAVNASALFNAAVAGVTALIAGSAPGIAVHAHFVVPAKMAQLRAMKLSAPVAAAAKAAVLVLALGAGVGIIATQSGCNGANYPVLDKIEQVVVKALQNGETDAQIAFDVCATLGGSAVTDAVCANVGPLVADTIQLLIAMGVLQGPALDRGNAYLVLHPAGGK